ncbi:MAG: flagellar assembly protein FliW [Firmicutes bacterium]|nr:flagellar assembly protein FliW [Bacillota bacterium]
MDCSAEKIESRQPGLNLSFPWGMPGLDFKHYTLFSLEADAPFYFLQSADDPEVGLLLINPFVVFPEYEFDLSEEAVGQLNIKDEKKIAVLCTVNASRGMESATVNLLAPIVINTEKMMAKQVVLNDRRFSLRTPLKIKRSAEKEEG